jgi:hypothetical protein
VLVQKYNEAATINEFFCFGIDENMKVCKFDDTVVSMPTLFLSAGPKSRRSDVCIRFGFNA